MCLGISRELTMRIMWKLTRSSHPRCSWVFWPCCKQIYHAVKITTDTRTTTRSTSTRMMTKSKASKEWLRPSRLQDSWANWALLLTWPITKESMSTHSHRKDCSSTPWTKEKTVLWLWLTTTMTLLMKMMSMLPSSAQRKQEQKPRGKDNCSLKLSPKMVKIRYQMLGLSDFQTGSQKAWSSTQELELPSKTTKEIAWQVLLHSWEVLPVQD